MEGQGIGMDLIWGISIFSVGNNKKGYEIGIILKECGYCQRVEKTPQQQPQNQVMSTIDVIIFWKESKYRHYS